MARPGTALRESLRPYLGSAPTTRVERGATICRPASETPSIADPERYPFACIVRASAAREGLEVEVVLGFVGTALDGKCWRAANERIAATTSVTNVEPRLWFLRRPQIAARQPSPTGVFAFFTSLAPARASMAVR